MIKVTQYLFLWLLLSYIAWIENNPPVVFESFVIAGIVGMLTLALFIGVYRIMFATKTIHFYYWLLRTLHLREKAKITMVKDSANEIHFQIDKLDPGETVSYPGIIAIGGKKEDWKEENATEPFKKEDLDKN